MLSMFIKCGKNDTIIFKSNAYFRHLDSLGKQPIDPMDIETVHFGHFWIGLQPDWIYFGLDLFWIGSISDWSVITLDLSSIGSIAFGSIL